MIIARQSTAKTVTVGPVLDADGVAVTDCVVADFKISKNGGAPAALNGSATLTHRHTGYYSLALTLNDLDTVGQAEVTLDDTTNACPVKEITIVEEAVYDAQFAAAALGYIANAPVNIAQWLGVAPLALSSQQVQAIIPSSTVVNSVTSPVTVGTNNDKTGYGLSTGAVNSSTVAANAFSSGVFAAGAFNAVWSVDFSTLGAPPPNVAWTYLFNVDVAVSSRAAPGDEMDLVDVPNVTARHAFGETIEGHLMDEGDGQMLINAIVGAIGNTNIDQAVLVAAIRADLERSGGNLNTLLARLTSQRAANLDNLDATTSSRSTLTAAQAATQVRTELTTELARIDTTVSSRSTLTAAQAASQVRVELSTELGRIDVPISTRASQVAVDDLPTNSELASALSVADDALLALLGTPEGDSLAEDILAAKTAAEIAAVAAARLDTAMELDGAVYRFTANALELAPAGGGGGGSGDATLANQELILEQLDVIETAIGDIDLGTGAGANVVTITVTDGVDPLENATVRVTEGAQTYSMHTDVNGVVQFSLDSASWLVSITKAGYQFTPVTLVVDGTEAVTYAMDQVTMPASPGVDQVTGYYYVYDENGEPEESAKVYLQMRTVPPSGGVAYDSRVREGVANAEGLVTFTGLFKGATYNTWRNEDQTAVKTTTIPADAASPYPLSPILGMT